MNCGGALSTTAASESDPPMAVGRDGFLSPRSHSYIAELLDGERELDRDAVAYKQLAADLNAAFADFARLGLVDDLDLLVLWATGSHTSQRVPVEDMTLQQFQDWLAKLGLNRLLRLYDEALNTEFETAFEDRLDTLLSIASEEFDVDLDGVADSG